MKHIIKHMPLSVLMLLSGLFLLATTGFSFAIEIQAAGTSSGGGGASTLGDMIFGSCKNTRPLINTFNYVAYAVGVTSVVMGIHHFRLHTESPQNHSMTKPLMLWLGAALLLVLPSALKTAAMSLGYAVSPTMAGCLTAGSSGGGTGVGLDGMMANFVGNIKAPLIALTQVIANVCGVFMMVHGLIKASKYGFDPKTHSAHSILTNVAFGAILFTIGGNFSMVTSSVFGTSSVSDPTASSVLSWRFVSDLGGGSQQFATAVAAALAFIQVIGFIAFVRGWLLLKKVVEGGSQATMAQAITHIVGGVLAINIPQFIKIMDRTFGTNLFQ